MPKFADTGLAIETPRDHFLMIVERSSTFKKWGVQLGNTVGIVDSDYAGNDDKIKLFLHWTKIVVDNDIFAPPGQVPKLRIPAGTRLAQGLFIPVVRAEFDIVEDLTKQSRGGFGSTG